MKGKVQLISALAPSHFECAQVQRSKNMVLQDVAMTHFAKLPVHPAGLSNTYNQGMHCAHSPSANEESHVQAQLSKW